MVMNYYHFTHDINRKIDNTENAWNNICACIKLLDFSTSSNISSLICLSKYDIVFSLSYRNSSSVNRKHSSFWNNHYYPYSNIQNQYQMQKLIAHRYCYYYSYHCCYCCLFHLLGHSYLGFCYYCWNLQL